MQPTVVQGPLVYGVKNAQSYAAVREHVHKVYRIPAARAASDGILKGISICTRCADDPEGRAAALAHAEGALEPQGIPLPALKGTHAPGYKGPPPSLASLVVGDFRNVCAEELRAVQEDSVNGGNDGTRRDGEGERRVAGNRGRGHDQKERASNTAGIFLTALAVRCVFRLPV